VKGHIRERSPGCWAIVVDGVDPQTGERKRKWHSFRGNKRGAQLECARLIAQRQDGGGIDPSRETVSRYLDRWLEHVQTQVSPRTHERYVQICRLNVAPLIGAATLAKLRPEHISHAYAQALASGRRDGTGGLSAQTVHHMHTILRGALQQAVRWRLITVNPADAVKPPRTERKEVQALDADGTIDLIEAARGTNLFPLILLCVMCGLRRSKSGKQRSVALSPFVVEELRRHRAKQAETMLKLGQRLTADHHVVAREDGLPLQPRSLSQAFRKFLRAHSLKAVRLHDLRHSHATAMLRAGVHPKVAQERLGHSSITVTMDLYSHVLPGMQDEAVARVDAALQDALNRRGKTGAEKIR
jgi:integrase